MKTTCFALVVVAWSVSVQAGSYQVVYQEQIAGAEDYVHIDPILDGGHSTLGFVYAGAMGRRFIVDLFASDTVIIIPTTYMPQMSLNIWTPDSLLVFSLSQEPGWADFFASALGRIRLDASGISYGQSIGDFPECDGAVYAILVQRISFGSLQSTETGIIFEQSVRCIDGSHNPGYDVECVSETSIYDLNLNRQPGNGPFTALRPGDLTADPGLEYAWYYDYYYSYDFRHSWNDTNYGTWASLHAGVGLNTGDTLLYDETDSGTCLKLFTDDFIPGITYDEVLFYGYAKDLTGEHDAAQHAACYGFASGQPQEIWYTPLSGVTLDYVYKPQHYVAGMRGQNKMIAFNYLTGQLTDSVSLDRNLTAVTFFETGANPPLLNLVGRRSDTIFVYQFETPTGVDDNEETVLPSSLSLTQNYPNPFNGETVIRFSNNTRQHLTLTIYNVLGQEVITLYDAETAPGDFSVLWDGQDVGRRQVSSGVYFARLVAPSGTQLMKMVLLK